MEFRLGYTALRVDVCASFRIRKRCFGGAFCRDIFLKLCLGRVVPFVWDSCEGCRCEAWAVRDRYGDVLGWGGAIFSFLLLGQLEVGWAMWCGVVWGGRIDGIWTPGGEESRNACFCSWKVRKREKGLKKHDGL